MSKSSIFRGIFFPFMKKGKNLPAPVEDEELIKQSIIQIIMTKRGERVMKRSFGTDVLDFIFENADLVKAQVLRADILKALSQYEPRIAVKSITFDIKNTTLLINLVYVVIALQEEKRLTLGIPTAS